MPVLKMSLLRLVAKYIVLMILKLYYHYRNLLGETLLFKAYIFEDSLNITDRFIGM